MPRPKKISWPEMTQEYLRSIVHYDPITGVMMWLLDRGGRKLAGKEVGRIRPKDGYRHVKIDRKMYLVHRLAWLYVYGRWPAKFLDHKNLKSAENWISNLRECTRSQNGANRPAQVNNAASVKGVHKVTWSGRIKWKVQIYITKDGTKTTEYLGCYDSKEEAAQVYAKRASELFGEFARAA